MGFSKRRGRPRRTPVPERDRGTPELCERRARGITAEALDVCLQRGWIAAEEHRAGLHFRWLYTLKHGAPGPYTLESIGITASAPREDEASWRIAREQEFAAAVALLTTEKCFSAVRAVAVHHEYPLGDKIRMELKQGLALLAKHWKI